MRRKPRTCMCLYIDYSTHLASGLLPVFLLKGSNAFGNSLFNLLYIRYEEFDLGGLGYKKKKD